MKFGNSGEMSAVRLKQANKIIALVGAFKEGDILIFEIQGIKTVSH